jgi:hypothetical protein
MPDMPEDDSSDEGIAISFGIRPDSPETPPNAVPAEMMPDMPTKETNVK